MKKVIIYLSIIVALFVGLYWLNYAANGSSDNPYGIRESKLNSATRAQLNNPDYQNIILPDQLKTMLDDKKSGFVYFFKSDCPHCIATTPLLNPMADSHGVDLQQFNLLEFPDGWETYQVEATPTLVYYKNGVEAERIVGGMEQTAGDGGIPKQQYDDFLAKYSTN